MPTRVDAQQVYESPAKDSWSTLGELGNVSGEYIGFAFGVAILVTVLDFFDHNVSAALAQQPEFGLRKGTAYSYDFLLQAVMFAVFGLCGLPPTNCVVPQAPLHTDSLCDKKFVEDADGNKTEVIVGCHEQRVSGLSQASGLALG